MKIFEFIDKYCSDLVKESEVKKDMVDLSEFMHDDIIEDIETGAMIPVVYVDSLPIPVMDFIVMDLKDFLYPHNTPTAEETYKAYMENLNILEGEEALYEIREQILAERKRIQEDVDLVLTI